VNVIKVHYMHIWKCHALYSLVYTNKNKGSECQWPTPVILTTWEAEIRRITVGGQPEQIVYKTHLNQ
jgi:hypothetical protein